jgi:hypothetical protein
MASIAATARIVSMNKGHGHGPRQPDWRLLLVPVIGLAAVVISSFAAFAIFDMSATILLGDNPGQARLDYADSLPNSVFMFVIGFPLVKAACIALILGGTALAAFRRWPAAIVMLVAVAVAPWIAAALVFNHLFSLPG